QPTFTLPDLTNLLVKKPKFEITDQNIDQAMQNLREQQGTLVPVEDRGVEAGDYLIADVHVKQDGNVVVHQHDAQIVARAARVAPPQLDDLGTQLAGAKPGEPARVKTTAPDPHPNEELGGKEVEVESAVKDIKKLELAALDEPFLTSLGFQSDA